MEEISTKELDDQLKNIKPEELSAFSDENAQYLAMGDKAFGNYFKDVVKSRGMFLKDVYIRADLTEKYGEKLTGHIKHTVQRDVIIRLCLAGRFNLDETNRALKLYGMNPLYSKVERDIPIIVAINNRMFKLVDVNKLLEDQGFSPLSQPE